MAITMKSEYAIKLMILLAFEGRRMTAKELVRRCRERLPLEFVEKILADLSRKRLLKAHRGRSGGYEINGDVERITVFDIVSSVDNPEDTVRCFVRVDGRNESPETCAVSTVWTSVIQKIEETLKSITLRKLVDDYKALCRNLRDESLENSKPAGERDGE